MAGCEWTLVAYGDAIGYDLAAEWVATPPALNPARSASPDAGDDFWFGQEA